MAVLSLTSFTICLLAQPQVQRSRASGRTRATSIKKADALLYLEPPNKSRITGYSDATRLSKGSDRWRSDWPDSEVVSAMAKLRHQQEAHFGLQERDMRSLPGRWRYDVAANP
jgi:hypothetical protein